MKGRISALVAAGFACALIVGLVSVAPAADTGKDVKRVCSTCHSTKRICLNFGIKDRVTWKETVIRMARNGAQMPLSRVDEFVDYLEGQKPGRGPLCL